MDSLGVMNQYRVQFDELYIIASLSKYRRQRKLFPWFMAVKIVCFLGLAAILVIIVYAAINHVGPNTAYSMLVSLIPTSFIVLLILGPRLDYFFLKRRLKKSPFYGGTMQISVKDAGVFVDTPKSQSSLSWSAFTAAKRLAYGFILHLGPSRIYWLPDKALVVGTISDVERLLRGNVRPYDDPAA